MMLFVITSGAIRALLMDTTMPHPRLPASMGKQYAQEHSVPMACCSAQSPAHITRRNSA